jgi:hypothetical protein
MFTSCGESVYRPMVTHQVLPMMTSTISATADRIMIRRGSPPIRPTTPPTPAGGGPAARRWPPRTRLPCSGRRAQPGRLPPVAGKVEVIAGTSAVASAPGGRGGTWRSSAVSTFAAPRSSRTTCTAESIAPASV